VNDLLSRGGASTIGRIGERRTVPGPKSKAIFDHEAKAMAPGLQSIALFSQIVVDHAQGCTITDVDGAEYLDFIAGIAVGSLGHCHPHYVKRLRDQLERSTFGSFATEHRAQFLNLVSSLLPEGLTHLQLFSGGAEAVEAAFRLAKSVTKKFEFVGFWGGFHGKSAGVIGLLGGSYRNHQGPFPPGMHHSPYANCYRCPWNLQHPSCGLACAEHLRNVIKNDTQGEVAAIIIEPMQGTAGNVIPPDDFIHAVRQIADEFDALLIADEILVGCGRAGTMWASEQFGLKPDIMTIGKGIGGGFPLSAVASSLERMSATPFGEPSGSSSSYGGNPLAAAAGLAAVEVIVGDKLVENSARVGKVMLDALKRLQEKHRVIGDVRGRGLLIGVEMVADRKTKQPLDKKVTRALFHEALERGLITMSYSNVIRINPPLIVTEEEALRGVDILDQSFAAISKRFGLD
jgi:4-aminobutyrate aminotransferase-like enzyme